jgi:hypothetical protein
VTQIQSYQVLGNLTVRARFLLNWVVRGEFNSLDYSAELQIDDFQIDSNCSKEEGIKIMNFFDLEFEQTPWKHFVVKRTKTIFPKVQFAIGSHIPTDIYTDRKL